MRKLFLLAAVAVFLVSCGNQSADSPKGVVNAFIEASKKGDIDGLKKYITAQDAKLLELGQSFMNMLDSTKKNELKEKMANEFKEKNKDVKIDIGNEKIEGDNATVEVTTTKDGKSEMHPFALKKEEGQWKISLMSTGMKESGMSQKEMDEKMDDVKGMKDSLAKAINQLKGMSPDSLKKIMNQATDQMEKLKEAAEKANH